MTTPTKKARYEELRQILGENRTVKSPSPKKEAVDSVPLKNVLVDLFRTRNENASSLGEFSWESMNGISSKFISRFPVQAWFATPNASGDVWTLRVECRSDGADGSIVDQCGQGDPAEGQERILLFRSDQRGIIGKIVYSYYRGNETAIMHAKVQVLEVKDAYRGFDLGGLLVSLAVAKLARRCQVVGTRTPSPQQGGKQQCLQLTIHLDAEEDSRRHNCLVSFYRRLGFDVNAKAKISYLNNNDGETIRKVVMQRVLSRHALGGQEGLSLLLNQSAAFLPVSFSCTVQNGLVDIVHRCFRGDQAFRLDDWLIVNSSDRERSICFISTTGNALLLPEVTSRSTTGEPGASTSTEPTRFLPRRAEGDFEHGVAGSPFWMFQTQRQSNRYLACDPYRCRLVLTTRPIVWCCDADNLQLRCLSDVTPGLLDHYRWSWKLQTVTFVQRMRDQYLQFSLRPMTILDALRLAEHVRADPFSPSISATKAPSLRTLCVCTADSADQLGFPDWVVLLALVYHLGRLIPVLDEEMRSPTGTQRFDWTPAIESRVVGYPSPTSAKFYEFCDADEDQEIDECCSQLGMYEQSCGLDRVLLTFTGPEYVYHWLRHNQTHVPEEGLRIVRYASLVDWHSRDAYGELANTTDAEVLPLVADFHEMIQRAWWETVTLETHASFVHDDFEYEWSEKYANLASKYGLDGILRW